MNGILLSQVSNKDSAVVRCNHIKLFGEYARTTKMTPPTPAGMAKWVKNASKNEKQEQEIIKFSEASMIFLEVPNHSTLPF